MRIDCRIPVTIRVVGEPTDEQLHAISAALTRAVRDRLAVAEAHLGHGSTPAGRAYTPVELTTAGDLSPEVHRRLTATVLAAVAQAVPAQASTTATAKTTAPVPAAPDESEAFEVKDDVRAHPLLEEWLHAAVMYRYMWLRGDQPLAPLASDQVAVLNRAFDQLQAFTPLDWTLLERVIRNAPLAADWRAAGDQIDAFVHSRERAQAISDAARVPGVIGRLDGLGDLYSAIKLSEDPLPRLGRGGSPAFQADFGRLYARVVADVKRHWEETSKYGETRDFDDDVDRAFREAVYAETQARLAAAHFRSVQDFDNAVRRLRAVVRDRAVTIALETMRQSQQMMEGELVRYRTRDVPNRLSTELEALRRPPRPSDQVIEKLLVDYPILMDEVALRGALQTRVPDLLGSLLVQYALTVLNNIKRTRATLAEDSEEVFLLNRVVDEALTQMGISSDSVQAQLIHERRAAPVSALRQAVDTLLFALSFAWGPAAVVGLLARAAILVLEVYDIGVHHNELQRQEIGAHTGIALADKQAAGGDGWELFRLFLAATGVLPAAPRSLLSAETRQLVDARKLFAASEGRPIGFLPGTHFAEAGPGQLAIWHPDFPDEVFRLDADGLTRYSKAGGTVRVTGYWRAARRGAATSTASTAERGATAASTTARNAMDRKPPAETTPKPRSPGPRSPGPRSPGSRRPGFGSLGSMAHLSAENAAAEAALRDQIAGLIARTERAAEAFKKFRGARGAALRERADRLVKRLRSFEERLELGPPGYQQTITSPPLNEQMRATVTWLRRPMFAASVQVERLELQMLPTPVPTAAEWAAIDEYSRRFADLRALQVRIDAGEAALVAQRDAVRDALEATENAAARHSAETPNLYFHIESFKAQRRVLVKQGAYATNVGRRGTVLAATIHPGGLSGRSYEELVELLGQPEIELPSATGDARDPASGATKITWNLKDTPAGGGPAVYSTIRIDVPALNVAADAPKVAFESGNVPHLTRTQTENGAVLHFDDQGIVVPTASSSAHIPVRVTGPSDPIYEAIRQERFRKAGGKGRRR